MSFEIARTTLFEKQIKKLAKKHRSIKQDYVRLIEKLKENPTQGTPLGNGCYKVRLAITSKGRGKSGGGRVITFVRVSKEKIYLLCIYDKSEKSTISDAELEKFLKIIPDDEDDNKTDS